MRIKEIDIGVSHEIKIDDEASWIRFGARADVAEGEDLDDAVSQLSELVNTKVIDVVQKAVETVRGIN